MRYQVPPGLYAVGAPSAGSPVLVSANYKLSFDHLRGVLCGRDAWILVLDTHGINVVYGPVRASDLPAFLDARMKAQPEMRRVLFPLRDRLVLVPVELVTGAKYALAVAAGFGLLGGLSSRGYSLASLGTTGVTSASLVLASFVGAAVLGPALLPWLPGRAFALTRSGWASAAPRVS